MSYTVGAATSDDVTAAINAPVQDGITGFFAGWFYPTTLTTGRYLFSFNTSGVSINGTELRFIVDHATTDGWYETSGLGFSVNSWWFIAGLWNNSSTGPSDSMKLWVGSELNAPTLRTLTQTQVPVGTVTTSVANVVLGNSAASGVLAFQGEVGPAICGRNNWLAITSPFRVSAVGAVSVDDETTVYQRLVLPFWAGDSMPRDMRSVVPNNGLYTALFMPCDIGAQTQLINCATIETGAANEPTNIATGNNSTYNGLSSPRPYTGIHTQPWHGKPLYRR